MEKNDNKNLTSSSPTKDEYVLPRIKLFQSFKEAKSESGEFSYLTLDRSKDGDLISSFANLKTFVIAEPGYGKTRLLNELVLQTKFLGKKSLRIDLKKLPISPNIVEYLKSYIPDQKDGDRFKLDNSEDIVLCFDALDEVKQDTFSIVVEQIKFFITKYPKIHVVVACRWHFFEKYQVLFLESDFKYVRIYPFSLENIKEYLKQKAISENDIDKLIDTLHFKHRNLIIQTPRYLELLVDYINENGVEKISSLTRVSLFEYFIYKKLELEDNKPNTQKRDLVKRVLEKLALIMEIYQTNILTKDELMTFFDDLKSDLKVSMLQQVPLEVFYDKSLLKDNIETLEFDNTEFQEYLAAKEITRLGHPLRTVFDLSVDSELREIYPSWFNTLTFLIELDISLLKPIIDFGSSKHPGHIQDENYHRFLTKVNVHSLPAEDKKIIFEQIFVYYQTVLHWIDWEIGRNLALYFDISQSTLLKSYHSKKKYISDTERCVQLGNLARMVGYILEKDIFSSKDKIFWRGELIKFASDKNDNGVLQRSALFALKNLRDDSVLDKVSRAWEHSNSLVKDAFISLCMEVNPNHEISLKYFVDGTKHNSIHARHGIYLISKKEAIKKLLQYFIEDEQFLNQFIDRESIYKEEDYKLIDHIKTVWDEEIENKLTILIQKAFESNRSYDAEKSEYISNIAVLLKQKDPEYIFKFIRQINASDELKKNIFSFQRMFAFILEKTQVKTFIFEITKLEHGDRVALWTLQQIKFSKRNNAEVIYEEGRKYLQKEYLKSEKYWKKENLNPPEETKIYQEFQQKLQPSPDKYFPDVFDYYVGHLDKIDKYITDVEKHRLIDLVTGSVFDKFNPEGQQLTITSKTDGGKAYTTHGWISIFGDCIKVANKLQIDVSKYRSKFISYIPFAYYEHLEAIFGLVKDIQECEIKGLMKVYTEKKSDLWRHMPDSMIRAAKAYSIKEATPILKEFVDQNEFSIYDRVTAMETAEVLDPDKKALESFLKKYKNTQKELAEKAIHLLIEKYSDKKSIKWLFNQIIKRSFKFVEPQGAHSVGGQENELQEKEFASPLMTLKEPNYQKKYLKLLGFSFNLIKKDKLYYSYAQYIWQIVYVYFDNLKERRSYEPLKYLEDYITKHSTEDGANWFSGRITELRRSYMNFIGKPKSVAECILLYNNFKAEQYLEISSSLDLFEKIKQVVDKELKSWIHGEGRKLMTKSEGDIQKNVKLQLENGFLRRKYEIRVIREPQLLDDKRTDFLVYYGFIGPIVIEVKLSNSSDLKGKKLESKKSYKSMRHYMENYKAKFGIFLVIDNHKKWLSIDQVKFIENVTKAYQRIQNVEVIII